MNILEKTEQTEKRVSAKVIEKYIGRCTSYLTDRETKESPGILQVYTQADPIPLRKLGEIFSQLTQNKMYQFGAGLKYGLIKDVSTQQKMENPYIIVKDKRLIYFTKEGSNIIYAVDNRVCTAEFMAPVPNFPILIF